MIFKKIFWCFVGHLESGSFQNILSHDIKYVRYLDDTLLIYQPNIELVGLMNKINNI